MSRERRQGRGWAEGLTCGQMLLIYLVVIAIASAAALAFGYTLGIFDRFPLPLPPGDLPTSTLGSLEDITLPDQTNTPSQSDLVTATATSFSSTPIPSKSPTQAGSTTPSSTATPPATAPADVCAQLDLRFVNATSNVVSWRLNNPSGQTFRLGQIEIDWPVVNDAIFNVFVDGNVIWSSEDLVSPTFITTWIGEPGDRTIQESSRLEIIFGTAAAPGGYDLTLRFENGCEASSAH